MAHSPPLEELVVSWPHWLAAIATLAVVGICVLMHYEFFRRLSRFVVTAGRGRHRRRILAMIGGLLTAHVLEIWLFGMAYQLLLRFPRVGGLVGEPVGYVVDYVYFSAVTYTTLGFGDIIPYGPIRFMVGTEALAGLVLITWSASLTFVAMQRYWLND